MKVIRFLVGCWMWAVLAYASVGLFAEPGFAIPVILFWVGSAWMALRWLRGSGRRKDTPRTADGAVTIPLTKPTASPSVQRALSNLPEHCRQLIGGE